jgi:predicted nucleic acid-binding OB-fold protein
MDRNKNIEEILYERGERYGEFKSHSDISQSLKEVMMNHSGYGWKNLSPSQRESLDMIVHKIARILNGDPNYDDSWRDIAGYAELIVKELNA